MSNGNGGNIFSVLIYSYFNTRGNWENSKLCENTPPFWRRVSTQFLVFPIFTRVDITVYQHGKCFIFVKYSFVTYREESAQYIKFRRANVITILTL
jgi:hypothetical protein